MKPPLMTGYFASDKAQASKVHIVYVEDNEPLCGTRISRDRSFQWCSLDVYLEYVECIKCKLRWERLQRAEQAKTNKS